MLAISPPTSFNKYNFNEVLSFCLVFVLHFTHNSVIKNKYITVMRNIILYLLLLQLSECYKFIDGGDTLFVEL